MNNEYILIEGNTFKLILSAEDTVCDYYTDIYIYLILNEKRYELFKDNLLYLKNSINLIKSKIEKLEDCLHEEDLGLSLNEYYFLYKNNSRNILLDENEYWIGEKYIIFSSLEFATWLYCYNENIIMKITPVFHGTNEDNFVFEYGEFQKNYKDIFKTTISLSQLVDFKKRIMELCNSMLSL